MKKIFDNSGVEIINFGTDVPDNLIWTAEIELSDNVDTWYFSAPFFNYYGDYIVKFSMASAIAQIYKSKNSPPYATNTSIESSVVDNYITREFDLVARMKYYDADGDEHEYTGLSLDNVVYTPAKRYIGSIDNTIDIDNKFLTRFRNIYHWEGYPLTTNFLSALSTQTINFGSEPPKAMVSTLNKTLVIPLNKSGILSIGSESIYVNDVCTSRYAKPLYVRWLNSNGGFDYYMFDIRSKGSNREMTAVYNVYTEDMSISENQGATGKAVDKLVEANCDAEIQDISDLIGLEDLFYSPEINAFINGKWVKTAVLNDFSNSTNSASLSVKFALPNKLC